ncbi:hypothetical protein SBRCBS47491_004926 [Sporothrix bragantina]|uniref:Uncharacterized protein n=1 Tax=Sporothrix bragantina TaxID=671064 RepID=A0ABP0BUF4_9PEZI
MVFHPPAWVPKLPIDPPDSIPIVEFMRNEAYGRHPLAKSHNPYTCGITGQTYSWPEFLERSELLARGLGANKTLGWSPNAGTPWDKVACLFSLNTIDYITVAYAVHRFSGILTPANAAYSAPELQQQLVSANVKVLFTCLPLLETALQAAKAAGLSSDKIYLLPVPNSDGTFPTQKTPFLTVNDLIRQGTSSPELPALQWSKGQGARQPAFLCYSSGTSGLPKAVMISHRNVIANSMQHYYYEKNARERRGVTTQVVSAPLPFSHIFGLVTVCHSNPWRGDGVIVLPKFEFEAFLGTIQRFRANHLILVPPILVQMVSRLNVLEKYDLSSVHHIMSGAAPLAEDVVRGLQKAYPSWNIGQGWGMTETSTVVCWQSQDDVHVKGSGSLLPGARIKLMAPAPDDGSAPHGREITEYDTPGEIYVQAPSVVLGYLHNERATDETFVHHDDGRWIRTGDEGLMTIVPGSGNEHLVVVDRIKELIKVKGFQVAPAELESHILGHPDVSDCAVIQVPDDRAGEVPKAFVVRDQAFEGSDADLAQSVAKHVEATMASYKWLKGGVDVIEAIPKSPSGKILRRLLRDQEREKRRKQGSKL